MENLFWIGFAGAAVALLFALMQRNRVMAFSEGNEKMRKIAASIRAGANAYLNNCIVTENYSTGKKLKGLVKRREWEAERWAE